MHYIRAGATVAIFTKVDDGAPATDKTRYLHKDHLGSLTLLTDESGLVAERRSFDPHGKQRGDDWTPGGAASAMAETRRGFTGHEHIDTVGLIHMNGRVYDPEIGRFLSADPFVQAPENLQSFNRYSYVNNNPLSYTDPSGFFFKKLFKKIVNFLKNNLMTIVTIAVVALACGPGAPVCAALVAAAMSFVTTMSYGGSLSDAATAAAISAGTAAAFAGVGAAFEGMPAAAAGTAQGAIKAVGKAVAHGVVGAVSTTLRGGKALAGALSAGFTSLAGPTIQANAPGGMFGQTIAAAVVGGTASEIGGGKFANGALTGAFEYLFNELGTRQQLAQSLEGTPDGETYPWGKEAEAALNSNVSQEQLLRDEMRWWERARALGTCGEECGAMWYRQSGYEVYDGLIVLRTTEGIRKPDLAFRLPGQAWAFTEVKANASPLIREQILKDRAIETVGYVGLQGPPDILCPRGAAHVTLVRVKIP